MIIDSHVHVGQFYDRYFSPAFVSQLMSSVGVNYYAVSSTTMCDEDYLKVLAEIKELIALDGKRVLPVMWITPYGLQGSIAWFLESDVPWRCLKVHPFLHPGDWEPCGPQFCEVIDIARELHIPLLIHTGNDESCQCGKYGKMIAENADVNFILAHGQPLKQLMPILRSCANAYADSAFMPVEQMCLVVSEGFGHKLLWGTDMCIPKHFYPEVNLADYYREKIVRFRESCPPSQFHQVTQKNAQNLFAIPPNSPHHHKEPIAG